MSTPKVNETINLTIHNIGSSGEGIGYYHGFTVFVDGALPGEVVEATLFQCQKRYGRANLVSIITPSPDRVTPPCPLFGRCGGCQLMHLSYSKQLMIKQQKVIDALKRIGKIDDANVRPCLASPSPLEYRNKIQLPVREGKDGISIGLYAKSSHDLIEVDTCLIHCPLGESIYKELSKIIKTSGIKAYHPSDESGELRHVIIKSAVHRQEALVILVTSGKPSEKLKHIAKELMLHCHSVKGVVHNMNKEKDNVILGNSYATLEGVGFINETLCGLTFKVSPASFFQVNTEQAECLYNKALEFADLKGQETVLDAYCGVGTLSLLFAKQAKKVIGVECVAEAISDAKENAALNHLSNVEFVCANSEEFIKTIKQVDVVLLNPPRKGCDPAFLEGIGKLLPKKVVYISCDPATLARDLSLLQGYGYVLDEVQPYDMFPQTAHVECVARLNLSVL